MRFVAWIKYGDASGLSVQEAEVPEIQKDEVLVKNIATTVSLGDCELGGMTLPPAFRLPMRAYFGLTKPKAGATLGQEFSGVVVKCGENIDNVKVGDEIFGLTGFKMGAYAEYMTLKGNALFIKKPKSISFETAACLPLGGLEAWYFIQRASIKKGSSILVIGGGGSIGTMGIQLAKHLGAAVTGVDTTEKQDVMRQAGAGYLIDFIKTDYLHDGKLYDAVLDVAGKIELSSGMAKLKRGGVYLHTNPKIFHMLFGKSLSRKFGKKIIFKTADESHDDLEYLCQLAAEEKINPIIDSVMPLEKIVEAHRYVEANKKKGNLVIKINDVADI